MLKEKRHHWTEGVDCGFSFQASRTLPWNSFLRGYRGTFMIQITKHKIHMKQKISTTSKNNRWDLECAQNDGPLLLKNISAPTIDCSGASQKKWQKLTISVKMFSEKLCQSPVVFLSLFCDCHVPGDWEFIYLSDM